jgi:DMSO/TMAO reductase YedYZ molybdopterin-dependent catalytic subunit
MLRLRAMSISRAVAVSISGVCLSLLIVSRSAGAQQQAAAEPTLQVTGSVATPLTLSSRDLKTMPRSAVTLKEEGRDVKYEGVLVGTILARAGAALGRDLTGAAVASYVIASASDGYRAVFSLAELDPAFTGSEIIVADTVDGKPLFEYQGPFRIVAPHDTRGARGVRMLQKLEVVRLPR